MKSSKKVIVSKFGGTSMGDARCMLRSAQISVDRMSSLVVVSATSGTTNALLALIEEARSSNWEMIEKSITEIQERHYQILNDLNGEDKNTQLEELFDELYSLVKGIHLLKDCSAKISDAVVSIGERLSSVLFTQALEIVLGKHSQTSTGVENQNAFEFTKIPQWLDARQLIKTDEGFGKAKVNLDKTERNLLDVSSQIRNKNIIFVTQGFIGSTEGGQTTTLGRGGSDYSAAIFAEAVNADTLEIWTDVAGIATTDPRICKDAKIIPQISFQEAAEFATFGAKILHPATLLPAMRKNIPVYVASSFTPEQGGTWLHKEVDSYPLIRGMALRKKQALITLSTPEMLNAHGFLAKIFNIFNVHKISIDAITTSEISVAMTVDVTTLSNKELIEDLSQIADVKVETDLTLVALIGNNINHTPGLANKIFSTISDINVRMICYGASKHNFCFLVDGSKGEEVILRLHRQIM